MIEFILNYHIKIQNTTTTTTTITITTLIQIFEILNVCISGCIIFLVFIASIILPLIWIISIITDIYQDIIHYYNDSHRRYKHMIRLSLLLLLILIIYYIFLILLFSAIYDATCIVKVENYPGVYDYILSFINIF